jgi:hypothetical protein
MAALALAASPLTANGLAASVMACGMALWRRHLQWLYVANVMASVAEMEY